MGRPVREIPIDVGRGERGRVATRLMKTSILMSVFAGALVLGSAAFGLSASRSGLAASKPACLTRAAEDVELEMAQIHATWRYLYVPGTDASNPLLGSATLRATALGLAHDLAEGTIVASDITAEYLAERAILCGYPEAAAHGFRGVATGTGDPELALMLMTSEIWGPAAGIRVPAYVDGLPMRCIGLAHAAEAPATAGSSYSWRAKGRLARRRSRRRCRPGLANTNANRSAAVHAPTFDSHSHPIKDADEGAGQLHAQALHANRERLTDAAGSRPVLTQRTQRTRRFRCLKATPNQPEQIFAFFVSFVFSSWPTWGSGGSRP